LTWDDAFYKYICFLWQLCARCSISVRGLPSWDVIDDARENKSEDGRKERGNPRCPQSMRVVGFQSRREEY
jgi:hypothetical protein